MPSDTKLPRTPTYTTRGAMETLIGDDVEAALARLFAGDWGDVCAEDRRSNDLALSFGQRLLSSYRDRRGSRFWIITEADRSATCCCPTNTKRCRQRAEKPGLLPAFLLRQSLNPPIHSHGCGVRTTGWRTHSAKYSASARHRPPRCARRSQVNCQSATCTPMPSVPITGQSR